MSSHRSTAAVALAFAALAASADVRAQVGTGPEPASVRRPYRGLFGGATSDSPHSLVATASMFAAYDDNVIEGLSDRRVRSPWLQKSGTYQGATAGLAYTFDFEDERVQLQGHSGAQLNYFRHEDRSDALPSYQGDVAFTARLTRSLAFAARQSVSYASNYNGTLAPGLDEDTGHDIGLPVDSALDLFELQALRTATTLSLTQHFGRYTSLGGSYHFRSRKSVGDKIPGSRFRDYTTQAGSMGLKYSRPMTRNATLKLGYGIRASDARSGTGEPDLLHKIDAGVDYSRALSFSRRTSFSFGSGSAIAVSEPIEGTGTQGRTRARLTGHAALVHEMGRTWTAQLTYARGFRTLDGFNELYFTDSVQAGVGGLVTRQLSFSASAQWANSSRESRAGNGHRGQSASAQTQYAFTRFAALYARYVYYHYRYDNDIPLDGRFPRQLNRHGVRIGLTTSVPLIR